MRPCFAHFYWVTTISVIETICSLTPPMFWPTGYSPPPQQLAIFDAHWPLPLWLYLPALFHLFFCFDIFLQSFWLNLIKNICSLQYQCLTCSSFSTTPTTCHLWCPFSHCWLLIQFCWLKKLDLRLYSHQKRFTCSPWPHPSPVTTPSI